MLCPHHSSGPQSFFMPVHSDPLHYLKYQFQERRGIDKLAGNFYSSIPQIPHYSKETTEGQEG